MNLTTRQRRIATIIATGVLLLVMALTAGCQVLRQWDKQIADAYKAPDSDPVTTMPIGAVTPTPEPPAPVLEVAAGIAAFLGYGGLAMYIRSTKKNGSLAVADLLTRVKDLENGVLGKVGVPHPNEPRKE